MKCPWRPILPMLVCASIAVVAIRVTAAAELWQTRPPQPDLSNLPDSPHTALFVRLCVDCHDAERTSSRRRTRAEWAGTALPAQVATYPEAQISNGLLTARIYLPDAKNGYYRSTRFDWSGAVYSLQHNGNEYFGVWYDRIDPKVVNWVFEGNEIVAGLASGLPGPVNEFQTPLGWNEAQPGGTFIKLGVGVLRRGEGTYNRFVHYDVLDSGTWTVNRRANSVEFVQDLKATDLGYGYVYRKVVTLVEGKPEMVIAQSMRNTGAKAINSDVYNHHFMVMNTQPPGPDFTIRFPYAPKPTRAPNAALINVVGNELKYAKPLSGTDQAVVLFEGYGETAADTEMVIENAKVGAGVRASVDRPLIRNMLWSIRSVLAIEPYIAVNIEPGQEFTWTNRFEFYAIPRP